MYSDGRVLSNRLQNYISTVNGFNWHRFSLCFDCNESHEDMNMLMFFHNFLFIFILQRYCYYVSILCGENFQMQASMRVIERLHSTLGSDFQWFCFMWLHVLHWPKEVNKSSAISLFVHWSIRDRFQRQYSIYVHIATNYFEFSTPFFMISIPQSPVGIDLSVFEDQTMWNLSTDWACKNRGVILRTMRHWLVGRTQK